MDINDLLKTNYNDSKYIWGSVTAVFIREIYSFKHASLKRQKDWKQSS